MTKIISSINYPIYFAKGTQERKTAASLKLVFERDPILSSVRNKLAPAIKTFGIQDLRHLPNTRMINLVDCHIPQCAGSAADAVTFKVAKQ